MWLMECYLFSFLYKLRVSTRVEKEEIIRENCSIYHAFQICVFKNRLLKFIFLLSNLNYHIFSVFSKNVTKHLENKITSDKYHSVLSNFVKWNIYYMYFSKFGRH